VQPFTGVANKLQQIVFNERMNIFRVGIENRSVSGNHLGQLVQAANDLIRFILRQYVSRLQSFGMGDARPNVGTKESDIKTKRIIELGKGRVGLAAKASAPQFAGFAHLTKFVKGTIVAELPDDGNRGDSLYC